MIDKMKAMKNQKPLVCIWNLSCCFWIKISCYFLILWYLTFSSAMSWMANWLAWSIISSYDWTYLWLTVGLIIIWSSRIVQESTFSASSNSSHIFTLHLIIGCIYNLRISLTISFIWAVLILFWTSGSDVISKWGLFRYYFAAFIVCLYTSLSLLSSAFFNV